MTTIGWILAILVALMAWSWLRGRRSPEQLAAIRNALGDGGTLLDVRSVSEFSSGHLSGATNLPLDDIGRATKLASRSKPVVVYCQSGMRSARAASLLRGRGYPKVLDLGPMRNGQQVGLSTA